MNGILIAAQVEKAETRRDNTIKITLGAQELSIGKMAELFDLKNKVCAVYISAKDAIPQKDLDQVDNVDPDFQGKTQSQRIRGVLYKLFEQDNEGHKDFENFYKAKTELYIEHLKSKIK